jgi:hypothetical protein
MATPEATFFVFFSFSSLYHECNLSPLLRVEFTSIETTTSTQTYHPSKETWDPFPLSKAYNPYYEHSGARQYEQQQSPLDVGPFMPELVYILVSTLHTIRA